MNIRPVIFLLAVLVLVHAPAVRSQTIIMPSPAEDTPVVGLRFMRPNLNQQADLSLVSGTYDLYFRSPLNERFHFVADIPFAGFSSPDWDDFNWNGDLSLGNIYLGARHHRGGSPHARSEIELGMWLPTANSEMPFVNSLGMASNFLEMQRHMPKSATIYSNYAIHRRGQSAQAGKFCFQLGPEVLLPTTDEYEVEWFMHYGLSGGLCTSSVSIEAGVLGQFVVSEDPEDFSDRFSHALLVGGQITGHSVRPGLFFMFPLEDFLDEVLDSVLLIKVEFVLS